MLQPFYIHLVKPQTQVSSLHSTPLYTQHRPSSFAVLVTPLRLEIYLKSQTLPLSKHTVVSITDNTWVLLFREIITIYCENHVKIHKYSACVRNEGSFAVFQVLRAMLIKSSVFWNIMACSPLKVHRHFDRRAV
jgi:hypothetical protein